MRLRVLVLSVLATSLLPGCGGKNSDGLYGTSTEKASIKPVQPTLPPAKPATPATPAKPATPASPAVPSEPQSEAEPALAKFATFGEPLKLADSETISVTDVCASPASYDGRYVRLTGTVIKVCPHKGCWFEMADCEGNSDALFVKFPDPATGRLIPLDAVGKTVVAEGVVRVRQIPEEQAKHYKQEAGATADQLAKIKGPQTQLMLTSPRAQITGVAN